MSLETPETPEQPRLLPEQGLDRRDIHVFVLKQVQDHPRVEQAGARAHHQPVERSEPHCRCNTAAVFDRAQARAVAEMRDDDLAAGAFGRDPRQGRGDVFVRQPVKPVAADALRRQFARQGELLRHGRLGMVEGGIEAGDLRDARRRRGDGADRRDMVRLMQWRQRDQGLQCREHPRVDQHRAARIRSRHERRGGQCRRTRPRRRYAWRTNRGSLGSRQRDPRRSGSARRACLPVRRLPRTARRCRCPRPGHARRPSISRPRRARIPRT